MGIDEVLEGDGCQDEYKAELESIRKKVNGNAETGEGQKHDDVLLTGKHVLPVKRNRVSVATYLTD